MQESVLKTHLLTWFLHLATFPPEACPIQLVRWFYPELAPLQEHTDIQLPVTTPFLFNSLGTLQKQGMPKGNPAARFAKPFLTSAGQKDNQQRLHTATADLVLPIPSLACTELASPSIGKPLSSGVIPTLSTIVSHVLLAALKVPKSCQFKTAFKGKTMSLNEV